MELKKSAYKNNKIELSFNNITHEKPDNDICTLRFD